MIGMIRSFTYLDREVFLRLYKAFVRPHLEYGNAIWHPCFKRQSSAIERVQRRATKLLKECNNMSYDQRLIYLNLHSLKGRRLRGDLIEAYKMFNNIYDVDISTFFQVSHDSRTRNSKAKIGVQYCRTNKRKNISHVELPTTGISYQTARNLLLTLTILRTFWIPILNCQLNFSNMMIDHQK